MTTAMMTVVVSKLPGIEYIEENGVVRTQAVGSWGIDRIDARTGLDQTYSPALTGAGYTVYVIDTGVNDQHVDFGGRAQQVFCADNLYTVIGGGNEDCNGHGTHCSGTVGSNTYGVAKGVNIVGVKVLGCLGSGSNAGVIQGIEWVISNARSGRSVASMSLGSGYNQATNDAVNAMVDAGIQTAVAAGNDNADACNYSPASAAKATSVGSTTFADVRSSFSNYGTCVDIFAPGSSITSTWIGGTDATRTISGTSMACPHVAGRSNFELKAVFIIA
ncbi:uncharacterized protein LOC590252 [Strongylocentrotus purpuratus]|uniref:Peptidase S8/S53 domain-containing protein n=1 Tax=Strongylocentrotus purpuratus TaxID=7668 RepID=A0A7M7P489_STRPU|nr:uncharacterized protein LOC590252 [Strongylocentrotus purpuratus]